MRRDSKIFLSGARKEFQEAVTTGKLGRLPARYVRSQEPPGEIRPQIFLCRFRPMPQCNSAVTTYRHLRLGQLAVVPDTGHVISAAKVAILETSLADTSGS